MVKRIFSNVTLNINNSPTGYVPNSLSYEEGLGEQSISTQSAGGGIVQTVYSNNVETNKSMVKFTMFSAGDATSNNIDLIKTWKQNGSANAITISDTSSGFTRTFQNMALVNNYTVNLQDQGKIEVEFQGDPAV